jgi:hypothetical protein
MLSFGVTIQATVLQRSEIPEGLTNYPVFLHREVVEKSTLYLFVGNAAVILTTVTTV